MGNINLLYRIVSCEINGHFFNCSYGEENGWRCKEEFSDYVWVLDPIDGTKSFITGIISISPFSFPMICSVNLQLSC